MKAYIGCSGFYNSHWKGIFYPEDLPIGNWFTYYCEHFNTFEINSTFYKFPTIKVLDNWYNKTPLRFLFAVKAPREITHLKKFNDCSQKINEFYNTCEIGLKDKLGCILFQFPPSFKYSKELLELIINSLKSSFQNVVEFRNTSWWNPEVFNAFKENNITFCSVNHPQLPEDIIVNTSSVYIRLHGNPKIFYSSYSEEYLKSLHNRITQNVKIKNSFVFFNNTASTAGILNAQYFNLIYHSNFN